MKKAALLGFSAQAYEALQKDNIPFIGVVPPEFKTYMEENNLPYFCWDFGTINEKSFMITKELEKMGAGFAVPLYEETVEWATPPRTNPFCRWNFAWKRYRFTWCTWSRNGHSCGCSWEDRNTH